jgi:hypothetical protein
MDAEYFVPWELAARAGLLGFNEGCVQEWGRVPKKRMLKNVWRIYRNFHTWNLNPGDESYNYRVQRRKKYAESRSLDIAWKYGNVAAPTYEQLKEWFRVNYDIDFIERPEISSVKKYICEVIIPGKGHKVFPVAVTPREALLQAFWYIMERVEPLPESIKEPEPDYTYENS